jgi:hypothetical protein
MVNNDDIQLDLNQDQTGQVIQNAGAQTTLAFKWINQRYQNSGDKKPRIRSQLSSSSGKLRIWQEQTTATYANVANAFKGFA